MAQEMLVQLEDLIDRLLVERSGLLRHNAELVDLNARLVAERDRLLADRLRVDSELGKLVTKLDLLAGAQP